MLQKFVNRAKELEFIERHFKSEDAGFIVLYGRRRVGKTELINRFIKILKTIPYSLWLQHRHDGNRSAGLSVAALW